MKTCVFVGPSAGNVQLPPNADRYTPAALGAIWRATEQGYRRILLVDGLFGMVPAVWHKEILYALSRGTQVYGASSMGALRAAELARYGMVGVGTIFRLYRAGYLSDDDEVSLVHAPAELEFKPLSLPMVSIRRTLSKMTRAGELERDGAQAVCRALKQRHFSQRTLDEVKRSFRETSAPPGATAAFERRYEDLKTRDYRALVAQLGRGPAPRASEQFPWGDLETYNWNTQFVVEPENVPPLQTW